MPAPTEVDDWNRATRSGSTTKPQSVTLSDALDLAGESRATAPGGPPRSTEQKATGETSARRAGWVNWLRRQLASGVGRRLFTMFVLAALAPVALMAVLAFTQVSDVLRQERDRELVRSARSYGMAVVERLQWAESMLADAASSPSPLARLAPRVGSMVSGVALLDRNGRQLAQIGSPPSLSGFDPLALDASRQQRRTALLTEGAVAQAAPELVYAVRGGHELGFIAVALAPAYLWGDRAGDPEGTGLCVAASDGKQLFCTQPIPERVLLRLVVDAPRGERMTQFESERGTIRAGAAMLPLSSRFVGPDLAVAAAQPEAHLLRPAHTFRAMFLPIAATSVLLVILLSIAQMRRILQPLHQLLGGMQRVAERDFATPVPVQSDDEFGQIANSFNKMTSQLGLHFRTLSAFSEIDRTILTTVDMRQVADIALTCIQEIAGDVKVVSLGLHEADSPGRTQVYLRASEAVTVREEFPKPLDLAGADASLRQWSKSIRLPANYRALLHEHGAKYLYLLPIARADRVWGVMALGHDKQTGLSSDQAQALAGVIDRLAVALSSVARDKQLHDQAHFDGLTGLPNRHYLMDMLTQQLSRARRDSHALGVLYIDLDRFKRTNDTLGHAAGDILLKHAADRIRRAVRDIDIVARLGGDEFTVVLSKLKDASSAGRVARTLIKVLNEPFEIDGNVMYAGASIGIAIYPTDGQSSAELLKKADTALYLAKDRGRGRYAFFEERMNVDASARATIDRELREALKRSEFRVHYQPQIDLATGEVCAVEALLRWQHPQRGLLAPASFLDHAEESGLIEAIGTWLLREACEQHRRWLDAGLVLPRVSVNVSAVQLRNSSFAASVEGALTASTTSPHHLELEVTESLFLDAGPDAVATLERLRERGVEIAVDDFGTGYSSFAYVKQLPAQVLKLDRSFIVDVVDDPKAAIIAGAIIEMAHALGKTVVAEGVETAHQAQFLRKLNCARAQGFVFSAALPPEQIATFVSGREREPAAGFRNTGLQLVHSAPG
jgi:diguanylate cyclase (GGDEF)-like protein